MQLFEEIDQIKTLTPGELREFGGLGHLSDKEALEIIETLKKIALITHSIVSKYEPPHRISELRKV